jgi:PLAT/LH2 domain
MALYNVVLKTKNVDGAGTNADVAVQLRGQNGASAWLILDHPHSDDRERGDEDVYGFPTDFWLGSQPKSPSDCGRPTTTDQTGVWTMSQ